MGTKGTMMNVQMKAEVPRELRRQFLSLLKAREQSFAAWLRDHMRATVAEAARQRRLTAAAPVAPRAPH